MKDDTVMRLLRQVKSGKVSVEDARVALEDAALTEEAFEAAVNHGAVSYTHLTLPTKRIV